jgi:two-component system, chemotaxis family, protein-glutamate methylesterase/glutaminase
MMKPFRVAIIDDSAVCRATLRAFLEAEGDIEVVAESAKGESALSLIESKRPQLLLLDLQMPGMNGHDTISQVMAHAPLPILVVTSQPIGATREAVFESIRRGALDLAEKPGGTDAPAQRELRAAVRRLATIPVVRHVAGKLAKRPDVVPSPSIFPPPGLRPGAPLVVGVASSAGGPVALATFIGQFGRDLNAAIVVVQHLPVTFNQAFAEFLSTRSELEVVQVAQREPLRPGCVYLASIDGHIYLPSAGEVSVSFDPARNGHRPSADVLLESLAQKVRSRACGVILSGMGEDGARGLMQMRKQGALCLAQDRESAAVWGMPKVAMESGAAERALPPIGLAEVVKEWTRAVHA